MSRETYKYHYLKYNQHQVLRPSPLLLAIMAFLCKDMLLSLMVGASSIKGAGAGNGAGELAALINPYLFVSNLPILVVFFALFQRRPDAGGGIRWVWRNGRNFIFASVVMYLGTLAYLRGFDVAAFSTTDWGMVGVYALVFLYVLLSPFVKDTFAQFPEAREAPKSKKSPEQARSG